MSGCATQPEFFDGEFPDYLRPRCSDLVGLQHDTDWNKENSLLKEENAWMN